MKAIIKTADEIKSLRESGKRLAKVMEALIAVAVPGVSTKNLDVLAEKLIRKAGGIPVFKGYKIGSEQSFPASLCVSINEEVVHGIPSDKKIVREGDLLKLDIGMRFGGMVTDMARTVKVGMVSSEADKLVSVTEESLRLGTAELCPGARISNYSRVVQKFVEAQGFSVVRDLAGHGVGREVHEEPRIPNYVSRANDFVIREGMTLALEPMVNMGTFEVMLAPDNWTFVTSDGKLSAHFEDTVVITATGADVVTKY
jgi:methionyl aminopeptidase